MAACDLRWCFDGSPARIICPLGAAAHLDGSGLASPLPGLRNIAPFRAHSLKSTASGCSARGGWKAGAAAHQPSRLFHNPSCILLQVPLQVAAVRGAGRGLCCWASGSAFTPVVPAVLMLCAGGGSARCGRRITPLCSSPASSTPSRRRCAARCSGVRRGGSAF